MPSPRPRGLRTGVEYVDAIITSGSRVRVRPAKDCPVCVLPQTRKMHSLFRVESLPKDKKPEFPGVAVMIPVVLVVAVVLHR